MALYSALLAGSACSI
ncbi:hypothetical protein E9531_14245 [Lampropedia puyangensis]|uniref:Uncharacterized protein n=1 Tax=Lampropedia puyangensis TaxID=1330072 RepID=A0A4S8EUV4_9BURK|nr:hypothetical protein E9531_14245 [Lampropedia puyangensis]